MREWAENLPRAKKPLPLLSFPAVSLLGVSVYELTHNAALQAEGIAAVAARTDAAAAVCMMDLSVEAEAFGCEICASENEVPTVVGVLVEDEEGAEALAVPPVGAARTGLYIEAARMAKERVTDRPVLAGVIGPFSLAGRLMEVTEALVNCLAEPDMVHLLLRKCTDFLIAYVRAYKRAGLDGVVLAEPLAGLLSPTLESEFSSPYVKEIVDAAQDDSFIVVYHNCGPNTPLMTASIYGTGAAVFHFGDAVDLPTLLAKMPPDRPVAGNISPAGQFLGGTPDTMRAAVTDLCAAAAGYPTFVLSSGCDIPPHAPWENVDAFFAAASDAWK